MVCCFQHVLLHILLSTCEQFAGAQPSSVAGSGLDESPRKFVAHVRKCMLLYVRLLAHNGDLDALQAMLNTIKQPSWKAYADIYQ